MPPLPNMPFEITRPPAGQCSRGLSRFGENPASFCVIAVPGLYSAFLFNFRLSSISLSAISLPPAAAIVSMLGRVS